ncbi:MULTISPECIES: hypothetical protein [Legionella]|uniref:hypothetical protein n=1 Tax=Legionella TaxID=445 RepID=UPI000F8F47B9|nr:MULTISPECIES: hypothetical protein [Legionella]MCP0914840.1 hypothetical protein [Legionella sp. 27cVA30]RUR02905.1 hypothetical protein ELY11_00685 [Legionella septentrionalis]RUR11504.1 hypothetical protein ELY14_01795 [Legionella septentrionalis]RUR16769.1 hypothetical protein ELY10_02510 [Legionella septentrionalis]
MVEFAYRPYLENKRAFFTNPPRDLPAAKEMAAVASYDFLATHRLLLEQEWSNLLESLKKNSKNRQTYWFYCYYCCAMLESYYQAYGKQAEVKKYQALCAQIQYLSGENSPPHVVEEEFFKEFKKKIGSDLSELISTPLHISKIRDWVAFSNITRLQITFSRITVAQTINFARSMEWFDKWDAFFGGHTDVDGMLSRLNKANPVFNVLSVGLFVARFVINAAMMCKHVFIPAEAEKRGLLARFQDELKKRHAVFLNDSVWAMVNLTSNFAGYFNISAPVANWLTAGFLFFDVALLAYRRHLAEQDYLTKKEQYRLEIEENSDDEAYCIMVKEQAAQLEISWQAQQASFNFNIVAAILLMSGFSASLLLAIPAATPVCFLVCTLAISMYLSADLYGSYQEKVLKAQQVDLTAAQKNKMEAEVAEARDEFLWSMVKNTAMPLFIMSLLAISWQVALIFTAVYIAYECSKGYLNLIKTGEAESQPVLSL